jgi:hypothetical protein
VNSTNQEASYLLLPTSTCHFITLGPNIPLTTLLSRILNLSSSRTVSDLVSHPCIITGKIIAFYTLIFRVLVVRYNNSDAEEPSLVGFEELPKSIIRRRG